MNYRRKEPLNKKELKKVKLMLIKWKLYGIFNKDFRRCL